MMIDIPVIRDLAMTTSIGVAVLIFTKLMLLPVLLSYVGVSADGGAAQPARGAASDSAARRRRLGSGSSASPQRRWALGADCGRGRAARWSASPSA